MAQGKGLISSGIEFGRDLDHFVFLSLVFNDASQSPIHSDHSIRSELSFAGRVMLVDMNHSGFNQQLNYREPIAIHILHKDTSEVGDGKICMNDPRV